MESPESTLPLCRPGRVDAPRETAQNRVRYTGQNISLDRPGNPVSQEITFVLK